MDRNCEICTSINTLHYVFLELFPSPLFLNALQEIWSDQFPSVHAVGWGWGGVRGRHVLVNSEVYALDWTIVKCTVGV